MTTAIAGYAYTFKAPPQHHSQAYISPTSSLSSSINGGTSTNNPIALPTALLWTGLEPWMDAEYARQRAHPSSLHSHARLLLKRGEWSEHDAPNNAGYAVLSFACTGAAAAALAQVSAQRTMPNSARPFVLNWAPPGVGGATSSGSQSSASANADGGSGPAGSNSRNATSGSGSGSGSDAADLGASDYSGGSVGGGGGGEVVSPTSPLFPVAGTVGATHAGGMGGAGFGQQQLQGQGQGQSGVGDGNGDWVPRSWRRGNGSWGRGSNGSNGGEWEEWGRRRKRRT
ncbi:hypothetical protein B0H14DRAFT_3852813 [Mycena olivaceomarginata]|nr:hypothetical protein B0H14DRAFT_3852813 [Mycena olivaceomarginata]